MKMRPCLRKRKHTPHATTSRLRILLTCGLVNSALRVSTLSSSDKQDMCKARKQVSKTETSALLEFYFLRKVSLQLRDMPPVTLSRRAAIDSWFAPHTVEQIQRYAAGFVRPCLLLHQRKVAATKQVIATGDRRTSSLLNE